MWRRSNSKKIDPEIATRRFSTEIEITIFRILQEAVLNTARHSNAKNVFINMRSKNDGIVVEIEDDGDGFDIHSVFSEAAGYNRTGRGLGLLGMKERASLIGGRLRICSSKDSGTRVTLRIPVDSIRREDDKGPDS